MLGNVKQNTAPFGVFASAQMRPPWLSTIDRVIVKPSPMPLDFVL